MQKKRSMASFRESTLALIRERVFVGGLLLNAHYDIVQRVQVWAIGGQRASMQTRVQRSWLNKSSTLFGQDGIEPHLTSTKLPGGLFTISSICIDYRWSTAASSFHLMGQCPGPWPGLNAWSVGPPDISHWQLTTLLSVISAIHLSI